MGAHLFEGGYPIAKPDPQVNTGIGFKKGWINCPHPSDGSVAQQDRVVPTINWGTDKTTGLRTGGTGTIVTPIGGIPGRIDEGKLELSSPLVWLPARSDLTGIAYKRGGGLGVSTRQAKDKKGNKFISFHKQRGED